MKYKIGDTVRVAVPHKFKPNDGDVIYFDEYGRFCDKYGKLNYLDEYELVTIETQEQLDYFNV